MSSAVVKGLDFKNRSSWNHILKALAVFHRIAGDKCHSVMAQVGDPSPQCDGSGR